MEKTRYRVEVPIELQKHSIFKVSQKQMWVLIMLDLCFGVMEPTFLVQNFNKKYKIPYFCKKIFISAQTVISLFD